MICETEKQIEQNLYIAYMLSASVFQWPFFKEYCKSIIKVCSQKKKPWHNNSRGDSKINQKDCFARKAILKNL
jgi:hypothetical protein